MLINSTIIFVDVFSAILRLAFFSFLGYYIISTIISTLLCFPSEMS